MRYLILFLLVVALAAPLGGCGKKGELDPPDGKKSEFPRQYPR